jgi:hypothetical protein
MKAFAVFTLHPLDAAAWITEGCAYVYTDPTSRTKGLMRGEVAGEQLAVLRMTLGGALGDMARSEAEKLGGVCLEFNNGTSGFPSHGECYDALRRTKEPA